MSKAILLALGLAAAGVALGQGAPAPDPKDPAVSVPRLIYRSAFEGYRPFADQDIAPWRKANEEVGAARGHTGHAPGQAAGAQTSKPQPGSPQSSGRPAETGGGHGGHHQ